ncbi:MAG: GH1 family beta-glucosidase [Chloroflexi bacterium OHK40]
MGQESSDQVSALAFPPGFLWGAATSAYQIEGAVAEDGRGESIWDRFCRMPGRVAGGASGEVACDHYHRWPDDVALMEELGLRAYRFSIAWPRIFPTGGGRPNQAGIDFYRRLVAALRERGIVPMATLYHWDLPQALQERGGWASRETALRFAEYAACLFERLGHDVPLWATINEPMLVAYAGYAGGTKAPGLRRPRLLLAVAHHLLLAHGLAVGAYRQLVPAPSPGAHAGIGIALNLRPCHPASPQPGDVRAAATLDALTNRLFLEPLFRGRYPEAALRFFGRRTLRLPALPGDLAVIGAPIDFLGLNIYTRTLATRDRNPLRGVRALPGPGPRTAMGWEIYPPCITEALALATEYTPLPLYITENGAAFADRPGPDGAIHDPSRIAYLRDHLAAAHKALAAGTNLRGYFVWSLLDNFEWEDGYGPRFGLVRVDYATLARTPRASASWYRAVIARNGLA